MGKTTFKSMTCIVALLYILASCTTAEDATIYYLGNLPAAKVELGGKSSILKTVKSFINIGNEKFEMLTEEIKLTKDPQRAYLIIRGICKSDHNSTISIAYPISTISTKSRVTSYKCDGKNCSFCEFLEDDGGTPNGCNCKENNPFGDCIFSTTTLKPLGPK